jgi:hypothetical protein
MQIPPLRGRALRHIVYMVLFDAVVLWALFSWQYLDVLFSGEERRIEPLTNAIMVGIAIVAALWATVRIRPAWKDAIVFWRADNGFSSRRAFSELSRYDHRYQPAALEQKTGPFPQEPAAQQALWDRLFDKYTDVPMVRQLRGQFLLCYEIAAVSLLLVGLMLVLVAIRWSSQDVILLGPGFLLGQYIMFVIAARFMGDDLVKAVLALEAMRG